jgi:hypothetical protein
MPALFVPTNFVLPTSLPDWAPWVVGVASIVAVWLAVQAVMSRKRTKALTAVAPEIGFYFQGEDWNGPQQAPDLTTALFKKGRNGEYRNIMTGSAAGFRTAFFDYAFTVGYGRSQRTYRQTVAAFSHKASLLPQFALRTKGILQKIGNAFVHKDINFDSHPEFSRRYQLRGPDEPQLRAVCTPQLLSFLEQLDRKKNWRLEGKNDTLILYRAGKRVKPADFRSHLEETSTLATSFFSHCGAKSAAS